ncbi:MFS transporter [Pimelobacter sp. 30-1]|uniref:MFS transporter n=1 Tax=Pimelobacter sp. 30-1 TaxID=2004991 RepID=UPI001C05D989|nr:MFS transporter [Pimelobacter sp. 30-1]MBU2697945.1 hypothetical protein [Pimelobacter sp. 30-1]
MTTIHEPGATAPIEPTGGSGRLWTPRLAAVLTVLVLASEIIPVSAVLSGTALPAISTRFATTQASWAMTIAFLTAAVAMPLVGKLADMYGKKRVLLGVLALSLVGSVLSAVATSFALFLVGRALQGAIFSVAFLAYSLVRDVFPARIVPFAVSVTMTGTGLVVVLQPFLAGWLIDHHGVPGVYWFLTVLTLVLTLATLVVVPESPVRSSDSRLDLPGAFLLGGSVAAVLVGVSMGPQWGWTDTATLGLLALGVVLFAGWILQAGRADQPLIDLKELRRPALLLSVVSSGLVYGVGATTSSFLAILAMTPRALGQDYGFGMTASEFAIFGVVNGIAIVVGGLVVGATARRTGAKVHMLAAAVLIAAGALLMALGRAEEPLVLVGSAAVHLAIGLSGAAIPNLVIAAVPPERQVVSSSLAEVSRTLMGAVGTTFGFVILNANVLALVGGAPVYSGHGFVGALGMIAGCAVAGGAAALFLPRGLGRQRT